MVLLGERHTVLYTPTSAALVLKGTVECEFVHLQPLLLALGLANLMCTLTEQSFARLQQCGCEGTFLLVFVKST